MSSDLNRRQFLTRSALGVGALSSVLGCGDPPQPENNLPPRGEVVDAGNVVQKPYDHPNVILVRFGGGVRRRETVEYPDKTWSPFITKVLGQDHDDHRGVVFNNVEIASAKGVETSHGQGTLYLLTGQYDHYEDITHKPLADRFEPKIPTIFEYLRKYYQVAEHEALIVNGEDRINEEFYTFSNHHQYGVRFRSTVLSLYRFKTYLLREELKDKNLSEEDRSEKEKKLHEMENKDYRVQDGKVVSPELDRFWERWREYYGRTGLVNPRGDRVLTSLALRSIKELKPRLMMINYQDPDYVHWGNPNFYTKAISIIDEGVREIYELVQNMEGYRNNTVFIVVPDCGRDSNRMMSVPYQHHFNTKSAHQIFAVIGGHKKIIDKFSTANITTFHHQISVTKAIGEIMNFPTQHILVESLLKKV